MPGPLTPRLTQRHGVRGDIRIVGKEATPDKESGLTQLLAETQWANIKLDSVGVDGDGGTPNNLAAMITKLGAEVKANEGQKIVKFLLLMVSPPDVATRATQEIQRTSSHLLKPNGDRDFAKIVKDIQELWDVVV
jgi:hypothetical protein